MLMKLFLGEKHGKKWLILMKTYFLDLNYRITTAKHYGFVLPDMAVSCLLYAL